MMYHDLYTTEQIVQQRRNDLLRETEQARRVRTAGGPRKVLALRRRVVFMLATLLALIVQLQS